MMRIIMVWSVMLTMLMSVATTASAATVIYMDKTAWENALSGPFLTEDFADSTLNSGVSFVSTESGHINPSQENYQDVLASTSQNEPATTWNFTSGITGYGGNWTLGGPGGSGNSLGIYIGGSLVGSISNSYGGEFFGVISDSSFTSITLKGGSGSNQQNYRLDDMVYSPVPVPAAVWLFGSGLIGLVGVARRKKA